MKRIIMIASILLAAISFSSCKRGPQKMADKFCDARQFAYKGQIEKAEKIFDEIKAWGEHATEMEKTEYRRIILNN